MPAKHHGADKHRESPEHVHRLRTAVAIGREQRSQWPELQRALTAATAKSCAGTHPVVDLGIITAPFNVDRRRRVRRARDVLLTRGDACSVVLTFLLGELSMFTAKERAAITAEQQKHDDLLLLRAHDGVAASAAAHGGRAVAEKALAWYIHSATHTRADYVAKVDDDSMVNLPRLVAELRAVTATAPRPEHAHFGVHVYRVWNWGRQAKVPNAACGEHSDNGPPAGRGVLRQMNASVKEGGKCAGAMGPFPFLDGSFEVLGKGVLTTIFGAARVRAFASTEFERPRPPYWSHEDAGLGALIHREVSERNLPMTYVALRRWQHNRFWLNWADLSTLVDGDVLWSHYTRSAERSDYVGGAFASMAQLPSDGLGCGDCLTEWGWPAASSASTCCTKPKPAHRLAVTRSLRKRFANEAEINRTCGFDRTETQREDGRKTRLLAIVTKSNEADERYALREAMHAHKAAMGGVRACFLFDPQPPKHVNGLRKPGQMYNVRAWLLYEMGRRADLDMSALTDDGNFEHPSRAVRDVRARWWRRAQEHAKGPRAYAAYTMTSVDELIGAPVKPSHAAVDPGKDEPTSPVERLAKLAWAPKERVAAGHTA